MTFIKGGQPWNKGLKGFKHKGSFKKGHKGYTFWKGKKLSEEHKNKMLGNKNSKGVVRSEKHKKIIGTTHKGHKNPSWRGDKVSYNGLHRWVRKWKGRAIKCEHCGKRWDRPKSIQWANKSGKYLRDLSDWISLCIPCHKKYDGRI